MQEAIKNNPCIACNIVEKGSIIENNIVKCYG